MTRHQVDLLAKESDSQIIRIPADPSEGVDGAAIEGLIKPPRNPAAPWIIFFGGNGYSLYTSWSTLHLLVGENSIGMAAFAYRGYDTSGGSASEKGLKIDARRIQKRLSKDYGVAEDHLFIVGMSIGTGVAASLAGDLSAAGTPPAGLVLLAPYTSLPDVADAYFPANWESMLQDKFNIREQAPKIREAGVHALVVFGDKDEVIAPKLEREVAHFLKPNCEVKEMPGRGHNNLFFKLYQIPKTEKQVIVQDSTVPNRLLQFIADRGFPVSIYSSDYFTKNAADLPEYKESSLEQSCVGGRNAGEFCDRGATVGGGIQMESRKVPGQSKEDFRLSMSPPIGIGFTGRGHSAGTYKHTLEMADFSYRIHMGMAETAGIKHFSAEMGTDFQYNRGWTTGAGTGPQLYLMGSLDSQTRISLDRFFGVDETYRRSESAIGFGPEAGIAIRDKNVLFTMGLSAEGRAVAGPDSRLEIATGMRTRLVVDDLLYLRLQTRRTLDATGASEGSEESDLVSDVKICKLFKKCFMVGLDGAVIQPIDSSPSFSFANIPALFLPGASRELRMEISGGLAF